MPATHAPQSAAAQGAPRQATVREFFAVVFRRKWLILGLFAVTTTTVVVLSLSTPASYLSSGRVLVRRGEKESLLLPTRQVYGQWEEELGSEMEIVKSWDVLQRAKQILASRPGPKVELSAKQLDVEVMGKSNVIGIGYEDGNADVARRAASAVIDAYIAFRQKNLSLSYPGAYFDSQIAQADSELRSLGEAKRAFSNRAGVVDVEEQQRYQLSLESVMDQKRSEVAAELAQARAEQRMMQSLRQDPGIDLPTLGAPLSNENALTEIKRRIVEQEARLAELRESFRDDAPEVVSAQSTLETLRTMLRKEVDARLEISRSRIQALESRFASIEKDLAAVRTDMATMPNKLATMQDLDRRLEVARKRYEDLVEKSRDAQLTQYTSAPVTVLLLSPAGPAVPRNTRDYVRLALAPAFSLVVGLGLAFFIDGLDLTVRTAGQAEEAADLPVLAAITERRRRLG